MTRKEEIKRLIRLKGQAKVLLRASFEEKETKLDVDIKGLQKEYTDLLKQEAA